MNEKEKAIGTLIMLRREELGLGQAQLSRLLGVSKSTVCRWESGKIDGLRGANVNLLSECLCIPKSVLNGDLDMSKARREMELMEMKSRIASELDGVRSMEKLDTILKSIKEIKERKI